MTRHDLFVGRVAALATAALADKPSTRVRVECGIDPAGSMRSDGGHYVRAPAATCAVHDGRGPLAHADDQPRICYQRTRNGQRHLPLEEAMRHGEAWMADVVATGVRALLQTRAWAHAATAAAMPDALPEDLAGLSVQVTWSEAPTPAPGVAPAPGVIHLRLRWDGTGDDLAYGVQTAFIETDTARIGRALPQRVAALAARERRLAALASRGVAVEGPLARYLDDKGIDPARFVGIARDHGVGETRMTCHEAGVEPIEIDGERVRLAFVDGTLRGEFAFSDAIRWSKGCLTARGVHLPDVLLEGAVGRRVRDVVDHPWLEGLTVRAINATSGKGGMCLTVMTSGA